MLIKIEFVKSMLTQKQHAETSVISTPFVSKLHINIFCGLVVQQGVAVLLSLERVHRHFMSGESRGRHSALIEMFLSCTGRSWTAPPAFQPKVGADLR